MHKFTYDCMLVAAFTVEAATEADARRILTERIDTDWCRVARDSDDFDRGDFIEGEVTIEGEPTLSMIDGEDV